MSDDEFGEGCPFWLLTAGQREARSPLIVPHVCTVLFFGNTKTNTYLTKSVERSREIYEA